MGNTTSRDYLDKEPLGRLMFRLSLPSIIATITNLLYSIVDRIFLGHTTAGTDALTGLGLCMPIILIITAFAGLAANGSAPLASMELGRQNREGAQRVVLQAELLLLVFTIALMVVTYAFMDALLPVFGASDATLPHAKTYLSIYLVGTIFAMANLGLSMLLLAQGDSTQVLIATASGAVVHVGMDALFIFGFGWGIQGAATASVMSQGMSAALIVWYLRRPSSALKFEFRIARPDWQLIRQICSIGSGRFVIMGTEGILYIVLNMTLQNYGGDTYVGAITILLTLQSLGMAPAQGVTQGTQTIASYCYGAGNIKRVRRECKLMVLWSFALEFVVIALVVAFPAQSVAIFTSDSNLIAVTAEETPTFMLGLLFFGAQLGIQSVFMGLGRGFCSLTVACVRKLVLFIPLALWFPTFMGPHGVFLAEAISDFGSLAFCSTLCLATIPKMLKKAEQSLSAD